MDCTMYTVKNLGNLNNSGGKLDAAQHEILCPVSYTNKPVWVRDFRNPNENFTFFCIVRIDIVPTEPYLCFILCYAKGHEP
jgi:hypothetical protein